MPATVKFFWNRKAIEERVENACRRTRGRLIPVAHQWWLVHVPVGVDRTSRDGSQAHHAGELRDSWFAVPVDLQTGPALLFGASARYARYVELGTGKMAPRAPVRATAAEVFPFIEPFLRQELSH